MVESDLTVKTALIVMYVIGIICLGITFFLLNKINGRFFTKFSIGIITVVLVMGIILVNLFNLS
ncbi:hypothetical protein KTE19_08870 [Lentilactobacillus sp. IMAU92037]|uniref:hypothetical protein n=1 Tax=Lentilactobacillus TaxID=2767893 RepID=UPI001C262E15|nr:MULTISPECIES: hypothetical protein [Lentilactobacillus]MBU9790022.1 hypothetical protein [Lentilactobacillus dabitei]MBV0930806.1 hypothetical protein [Lentilactobacillus dabitei]MDM7516797.1 hypothetical protein [Lentilactobacillus sp. TOM.63]